MTRITFFCVLTTESHPMSLDNNKLVIVSNRLPVSVSKVNGKLKFKRSDGGLATALSNVEAEGGKLWIGWPGIAKDDLSPSELKQVDEKLGNMGFRAVHLTKKQIDGFYFGYSNDTLWPLFHYFPGNVNYNHEFWDDYTKVNGLFAKETQKYIDKDTHVWVHDYQLMLLPSLLRTSSPDSSIGFFLHIPFPSYEIFRLLPHREEILQGLLGADLLGFHTYDYARHFLSSTLFILGYDNKLGRIKYGQRIIKVDAFPISIDYNKFANAPKEVKIKKEARGLKKHTKNLKVILSVDRLDYSKGIIERLKAYSLFLSKYPEYLSKVQLIVVAVPSREDVESYRDLRQKIEQYISRVNGRYSTVDWSPISYRSRSIPPETVVALSMVSDVALITPNRDGMNLVAKEYVVANQRGRGVLILSEMAGVATEFPEALIVNPKNKEQVAEAIKDALDMPAALQKKNLRAMQARVEKYDIHKWADDFIDHLDDAQEEQQRRKKRGFTKLARKKVIEDYKKSKSSLFLLDYDGTLIDFAPDPDKSKSRPPKQLLRTLKQLKQNRQDEVIIISGRPKQALDSWFSDYSSISLVAEHGAWEKRGVKWSRQKGLNTKWEKDVRSLLDYFVERTPGSMVEEKDFALVWHYRKVLSSLAGVRKLELKHALDSLLEDTDLAYYQGNKIIEIKPKMLHKGVLARKYADRKDWDFIVAIGDDYTDEDIFKAMPRSAVTIKVGYDQSESKYHLGSPTEVIEFLSELATSK